MKSPVKRFLVCALLIGVGFGVGFYSNEIADSFTYGSPGKQVREGAGRYTNPLLECEVASGISAPKVRFERELYDYVDKVSERDGVTDIAVYYRDLNNGPTSGVRDGDEFFPASLLKVPIYLAFLKHAETDPEMLNREITFTEEMRTVDVTQIIPPEESLNPGTTYTVRELLNRMIKYSDNDALNVLYPLLPEAEYVELFRRLGLSDFSPQNQNYTLSVKEYSTFFRVLFNASYLSQSTSEEALATLADTRFTTGLRAGVPDSVAVAHKFGERELDGGVIQLHDCGIVYAKNSPYLLCIMTRGTNQQVVMNALRDISAFTYGKVTNI